jgi:hypothetical protein
VGLSQSKFPPEAGQGVITPGMPCSKGITQCKNLSKTLFLRKFLSDHGQKQRVGQFTF